MSVTLTDKEFVGLGGHDEVVAVQPLDLVSPPFDTDAAPFQRELGMMPFGLGLLSDLDGEF